MGFLVGSHHAGWTLRGPDAGQGFGVLNLKSTGPLRGRVCSHHERSKGRELRA